MCFDFNRVQLIHRHVQRKLCRRTYPGNLRLQISRTFLGISLTTFGLSYGDEIANFVKIRQTPRLIGGLADPIFPMRYK
jgi:hypothetical protein